MSVTELKRRFLAQDTGGSIKAAKLRKIIYKVLAFLFRAFFLLGFCFVILYPLLIMVSRAFMDNADLYDNSVLLIPKHFTLNNIKAAMIQIDYWPTLQRTVLLTFSTTLLQLMSCVMAGYGFARFRFKLRGLLFAMVIFTIVVPPQLISIPMYFSFKDFDVFGIIKAATGEHLNLMNTFFPFWMLAGTGMGIKSGILIYLFRQFFKNMPTEIMEAGRVDGANSFTIFTRLMLPNAVTVITTGFLFSVVWQYNDVVYSNLFLRSKPVFSTVYTQLTRLTADVMKLLGFSANSEMAIAMYEPIIKSAGVLLMIAPLLLMFLVAQKFFVQSVERSGIVG